MEDISALIKEAKPLYFARKRRRRIGTGLLAMLVVLVGLRLPKYNAEPEVLYDLWTTQIYITESGSVIEDMGLPVDEYGLLMVG